MITRAIVDRQTKDKDEGRFCGLSQRELVGFRQTAQLCTREALAQSPLSY